MYLNHAYFGNGVWGVEDASQKYFGVPASDLTVEQAATIAGMLKGPEIYNPYYSLEYATNRRDTVLQAMVDAKYIDQPLADMAMTIDMASQLNDTYAGKQSNYNYPSYFDAVVAEAINRYGLKESDIINNGYRIYTEMDQNSQASMQLIFDDESLFPVSPYDGSLAQGASVAMDPKTGGVRALVGRVNSSEDQGFRSFNFATQSSRSPGSTIKPLVAYAPAVAAGWAIDKELDNHTETYGDYTLHNYDHSTSETVPMYQALAQSWNLPVAAIVNELGVDTAFEYGKKFGLDLSKTDKVLGMAIGSGVSTNPFEMAEAYTTFANGGIRSDAHLITKIETASGKVLAEHKTKQTRVINQSVANKMTSMMLGTFTNGTGIYADTYDYTLAGKTGTTETTFDAALVNDQWVIGYTPDLVISQWMGFEKTDEQHYIDASEYWKSSVVFQAVGNAILPYTAGTEFSVENAYYQNGIVEDTSDANQPEPIVTVDVNEIRSKTNTLIQEVQQNIQDAKLPERVKTLWDKVKRLFE